MSSSVRRTCSAEGGSPCRCRSVSRTHPMSTERAARTPWVSPSTNSVDPPPMSTTRKGGRGGATPWAAAAASRDAVAPMKESSASSVPSTTSGPWPRTSTTMSSKSERLAASRVALVATIRTAVAPRFRAWAAYSTRTVRVRSMASGASRPVASTPCPRRTTSIRRSRSVCAPSAGTSATSSRMELVPQSIEATRVMRRPLRAARRGRRPTTPPSPRPRGRRSGCSPARRPVRARPARAGT